MADCEFCGSGVDVEAQGMGEGRVMMLCDSCRANIKRGEETAKRDALYNDYQFYGVPSDGTVAMLCSYPGCEAIAEIIQDGEPIPAGSIGRKHLFCPKHEAK